MCWSLFEEFQPQLWNAILVQVLQSACLSVLRVLPSGYCGGYQGSVFDLGSAQLPLYLFTKFHPFFGSLGCSCTLATHKVQLFWSSSLREDSKLTTLLLRFVLLPHCCGMLSVFATVLHVIGPIILCPANMLSWGRCGDGIFFHQLI